MDNIVGKKKKKYYGYYDAKVTSVDDSKKYLRAQVYVYDLFKGAQTSDLPWATYLMPPGSRNNDGFFLPVDVGDEVLVVFRGGDTRRPIIVGSQHYCPEGSPNFPHEAWSGPDKFSHKRSGSELTPTDTGYHRDVVYSQHGILVEIVSDTNEFRVTQKSSGSAVEIDREGNITAHSENNLFGSSVNDTEILAGGVARINAPLIKLNCERSG